MPADALRSRISRAMPRLLLRLAVVVSGGLIAVGVTGEVVSRTILGKPSNHQIRSELARQNGIAHGRFVPHPELGAVMSPLQDVWVDTPDFRYRLRTDRYGFANLEPLPDRADVVVLGNSLLTGAGVGVDGQFTTLLQDALPTGGVVNLGISGGGTEHQYRAYRLYGSQLKPKVVVASLWLVYEIDNTLAFRLWLKDPAHPDFADFSAGFFAARASSGWRDTVREAVARSVMASTIYDLIREWRGLHSPIERVVLANGDEVLLSADEQARLATGWTRPGRHDAREAVFDPLERLRRDVEAQGARLLVLLMPSKEETYAASRRPELLAAVTEARLELKRRGFSLIDLYPSLETEGRTRAIFYYADPHPNASGHRLIAEALTKALRIIID